MNEDIDTLWKYLQSCGLVTPSSVWGYTESFNRKSTLIASLHVANQASSLRDEKGMALSLHFFPGDMFARENLMNP